MRTYFLLLLFAGLVAMGVGCGRSRTLPPFFNKRTWDYTRYNNRAHMDDSGRVVYTTMDTTSGTVQDEIHWIDSRTVEFQRLVYYMTSDSNNRLTFEHIVYDSYDPIGYLAYYKEQDSITLKLIYGNSADTTYRVYEYGEEYWHSGKSY